MSRALQRMRDTFHDDLLVRTAKGYEPTPQGERVLQELGDHVAEIEDRLISKVRHSTHLTEQALFLPDCGIADNATSIIAPILCREVLPVDAAGSLHVRKLPRGDVFEDLSHGRLDLALIGDEGPVPSPLLTKVIY